jgi:hypothetical protein
MPRWFAVLFSVIGMLAASDEALAPLLGWSVT